MSPSKSGQMFATAVFLYVYKPLSIKGVLEGMRIFSRLFFKYTNSPLQSAESVADGIRSVLKCENIPFRFLLSFVKRIKLLATTRRTLLFSIHYLK